MSPEPMLARRLSVSLAFALLAAPAGGQAPSPEAGLGFEVFQLSYVESDRALTLIKALGYEVVAAGADTSRNSLERRLGSADSPVVIELPDARGTSLLGPDRETSEAAGASRMASSVPDIGGTYLEHVTAGQPQQRLMIVYDAARRAQAAMLLRLLREKIDVPARQIVIQALVVEVNTDNLRDIGVELEAVGGDSAVSFGNTVGQFFSPFTYSFDDRGQGASFFSAKLTALVETGEAEILSNPAVLVLDGRQARIQIGQQIPVVTSTVTDAAATTDVFYFPVGIVLNLRPRINEAGTEITMQVETIVSAISAEGGVAETTPGGLAVVAPTIDNRQVQSLVRVTNDTPFIIGGLISKEDRKTTSRIPGLSKIPLLGKLFQRKSNEAVEREVIIVLTPHVVPEQHRNFSYLIPKPSEIFDSTEHVLYRNAYRIRDDDVFDLDFFLESRSFQDLQKTARTLALELAGICGEEEVEEIAAELAAADGDEQAEALADKLTTKLAQLLESGDAPQLARKLEELYQERLIQLAESGRDEVAVRLAAELKPLHREDRALAARQSTSGGAERAAERALELEELREREVLLADEVVEKLAAKLEELKGLRPPDAVRAEALAKQLTGLRGDDEARKLAVELLAAVDEGEDLVAVLEVLRQALAGRQLAKLEELSDQARAEAEDLKELRQEIAETASADEEARKQGRKLAELRERERELTEEIGERVAKSTGERLAAALAKLRRREVQLAGTGGGGSEPADSSAAEQELEELRQEVRRLQLEKDLAELGAAQAADRYLRAVAKLSRGDLPGEEVLVHRMLWDIVDKNPEISEVIELDRLIYFERHPKYASATRVLGKVLADHRGPENNAVTLTLAFPDQPSPQPFWKTDSHRIDGTCSTVTPLPAGSGTMEPAEECYLDFLGAEDNVGGESKIVMWADPENTMGPKTPDKLIRDLMVVKKVLDLNPDLELSLREFYAGRQIVFPTREGLRDSDHVIDREVARLLYEVNFYYKAGVDEYDLQKEMLCELWCGLGNDGTSSCPCAGGILDP